MAEWRRFGLAATGYLALALLLVRSLFGQFSTAIAHDAGDPLLSAWILWWNAHHVPFVGSWWDGLAFFPLRGSLAFSDHRVGLELIAAPVLWLGGTPILAYNVTFVACFVLSALAAHALTRMLTGSHAAGAVSGIAFGFNPYRMAHLAHLELQAAFCLPLALLALHRYVATSRRRWLVAFSFMLALQGLCSGYYLFFSIPLVGLWILWFPRNAPLSRRAALIGAWALAFIVLLPVLLQYRTIHSQVGFGRGFGEMRDFSADLTGVLSAQPMKLWRLPSMAINPEAEVYVGVIAPLLILGAIGWRRSSVVPVHIAELEAAPPVADGGGRRFRACRPEHAVGAVDISPGPARGVGRRAGQASDGRVRGVRAARPHVRGPGPSSGTSDRRSRST